MSGFEWFLLVVVVITVPLVVAVVVTLWTLEQARQRNRKHRAVVEPGPGPVKRRATRTGVASGAASGDDAGGEAPEAGSLGEAGPDPIGDERSRVSRET